MYIQKDFLKYTEMVNVYTYEILSLLCDVESTDFFFNTTHVIRNSI